MEQIMENTQQADAAIIEAEARRQERMPFGRTLCIRIADNKKREVKSVRGSCEVLIDLPHSRRGPVYQATMEVIQSALSGRTSAEEAYEAFLAFAKHADVLV